MPKRSIRWPVTLEGGRAVLTDDPTSPGADLSASLRQIIRARCSDGAGRNPFRRVVEAGDLAFLDDPSGSRTRIAIEDALRGLEPARRARIVSVEVLGSPGPNGVRSVRVRYVDLETGLPDSVEVNP